MSNSIFSVAAAALLTVTVQTGFTAEPAHVSAAPQGSVLATEAACAASKAAVSGEDAARAQALLRRAVAHYKAIKDRALAEFAPRGEFVDGELYVYVVSTTGDLLASGGPSSSVVGRNVADQADALGKPFFREMLDKAQASGSGTVEYRWLNPIDNKVERKVAYFQKVDDRIIAVGFYVARATPEQAKALLVRAVDAVRADPERAIKAFNTFRGVYSGDDLYVFAVDLSDDRFLAHGVNRGLIGTDALSLADANGKPLGRQLRAAVENEDQAEFDYSWPNPVTGKVEHKHTYLRKVGQLLVGVGYYAISPLQQASTGSTDIYVVDFQRAFATDRAISQQSSAPTSGGSTDIYSTDSQRAFGTDRSIGPVRVSTGYNGSTDIYSTDFQRAFGTDRSIDPVRGSTACKGSTDIHGTDVHQPSL